MKKLYTVLSAIIVSFSLTAQNHVVPGNIIALLDSDETAVKLCTDLSAIDGKLTGFHQERILSSSLHIFLFVFDPSSVEQDRMLNSVKTHPGVKIAQFNHTFEERATVPNDANFAAMWDMENDGSGSGAVADADIDATLAWDITTGGLTTQGDTIVVAVVDGGFKLNHADLNFWKNYGEIPGNSIDDDGNGYVDDYKGWNSSTGTDVLPQATHGTHVSGTVGAKGNNTIGVTGVNWNCKVMPISYGSGGGGFEANVVAAYAYARDQRYLYNTTGGTKGAFVVSTNSSFGIDLAFPADYPLWCAFYDSLGAVGILSAGATANANYNVDVQGDIPTACPSNYLITVTNTKNNDTKTTSAGYGATTIDLGSPGTNITSTYYSGTGSSATDSYAAISGTSMATPHVAGAVGLMLSVACNQFITDYKANPSAMALVLKDSLLNATDPKAALSGITVTGGRLNLFNAVKSIQNYCLSTVIENEAEGNNFQIRNIYPNPASNSITISFSANENSAISISNVLGQEVLTIPCTGSQTGIQHVKAELGGISKGIYFVRIQSSKGASNVMKVIVK